MYIILYRQAIIYYYFITIMRIICVIDHIYQYTEVLITPLSSTISHPDKLCFQVVLHTYHIIIIIIIIFLSSFCKLS